MKKLKDKEEKAKKIIKKENCKQENGADTQSSKNFFEESFSSAVAKDNSENLPNSAEGEYKPDSFARQDDQRNQVFAQGDNQIIQGFGENANPVPAQPVSTQQPAPAPVVTP